MTEILTESFCERCGTRYTFESARPKTRLKGVKVLSRGLKNFVLSDDTSMDEAMAAARSESDREATAHQLDAFHKTFNFCMSCRQYTCPNCWNEPEARCLSCAPLALPEPVRLEDLAAFGLVGVVDDSGFIGQIATRNGSPTAHEHDGLAEAAEAKIEVAALEAATDVTVAPEATAPDVEVAAGPAPEPPAAVDADEVASVEADPARKAAAQTTGLLRRFRPGQNLDAELDAYERDRIDATTSGAIDESIELTSPAETVETTAPEPRVEETASAEATEAAAEPGVAEATPAAETATQPTPEPEPEPQPIAAANPADVVEQPTWRITAPDPGTASPLPPASEPSGPLPLQATAAQPEAPSAEPQWPARPQWPSATPAAGLPYLGRPAAGEGGIEALWAASNQELATAAPLPGRAATSSIQPCVSCGLSLSATARFCRRCGTLQSR